MDDRSISTLEQKKDRRGLLALIGGGGAAALAALQRRSVSATNTTIPTIAVANPPRDDVR